MPRYKKNEFPSLSVRLSIVIRQGKTRHNKSRQDKTDTDIYSITDVQSTYSHTCSSAKSSNRKVLLLIDCHALYFNNNASI